MIYHVHFSCSRPDSSVLSHLSLEFQLRAKMDELDAISRELREQNSSLQHKFTNEELEKLVGVLKMLK